MIVSERGLSPPSCRRAAGRSRGSSSSAARRIGRRSISGTSSCGRRLAARAVDDVSTSRSTAAATAPAASSTIEARRAGRRFAPARRGVCPPRYVTRVRPRRRAGRRRCAPAIGQGRDELDPAPRDSWRSEGIDTHSSGPWWPSPAGPNSTAGTPASRNEMASEAPSRPTLSDVAAGERRRRRRGAPARTGSSATYAGGRVKVLDDRRRRGSRGSARGCRPGPGSGR